MEDRADLYEDDRGPRVSASETQDGPSETPFPTERTAIFLPDCSHTHVRRSLPGVQPLQLHSGVGGIRFNHMLSSPSISKSQWVHGSKWIEGKGPSIDHEDSESKMRDRRDWGILGSALTWGDLYPSKGLKPLGTWSCVANELDLSQHWHPPKDWEESREWNCRTLATMRHLSLETTPKPKKCQAAMAADCLSTEGVWGKL